MIITDLRILRKPSKKVTKEDYYPLISILERELDAVSDIGVGLSAVQIGYHKKIGLIKLNGQRIELINPKIIEKYGRFNHKKEGCLSLPGLKVDVARYYDIVIENGLDDERRTYNLAGIESVAVQHEINHMNGKLIIDRGIKWSKRR